MKRSLFWLYVLVAVTLPLYGHAQTCTFGPFTSSTTIASLQILISGAADGDTVCLTRGQNWTGTSGITISTTHVTTRVNICASTGSVCSSTGAANPRLTLSGASANCFVFSAM